jgi:hypothetical protein
VAGHWQPEVTEVRSDSESLALAGGAAAAAALHGMRSWHSDTKSDYSYARPRAGPSVLPAGGLTVPGPLFGGLSRRGHGIAARLGTSVRAEIKPSAPAGKLLVAACALRLTEPTATGDSAVRAPGP